MKMLVRQPLGRRQKARVLEQHLAVGSSFVSESHPNAACDYGWQGQSGHSLGYALREVDRLVRHGPEQLGGIKPNLSAHRVGRSASLLFGGIESLPGFKESRSSRIARSRQPNHFEEVFEADPERTGRRNRAVERALYVTQTVLRTGASQRSVIYSSTHLTAPGNKSRCLAESKSISDKPNLPHMLTNNPILGEVRRNEWNLSQPARTINSASASSYEIGACKPASSRTPTRPEKNLAEGNGRRGNRAILLSEC